MCGRFMFSTVFRNQTWGSFKGFCRQLGELDMFGEKGKENKKKKHLQTCRGPHASHMTPDRPPHASLMKGWGSDRETVRTTMVRNEK